MARDAIGLMALDMEDDGKKIPKPNSTKYAKKKAEIEAYVDIDFAEYKSKHDNRRVRKSLTIPSWINKLAEEENINFSRVLEEALMDKISKVA